MEFAYIPYCEIDDTRKNALAHEAIQFVQGDRGMALKMVNAIRWFAACDNDPDSGIVFAYGMSYPLIVADEYTDAFEHMSALAVVDNIYEHLINWATEDIERKKSSVRYSFDYKDEPLAMPT